MTKLWHLIFPLKIWIWNFDSLYRKTVKRTAYRILKCLPFYLYFLTKFQKYFFYTIHKKQLCSSQKSPETWSYLPNPIFFTDFNYACCSLLNSTVSKWIPDIIFLQEFTYKFFCLLVHVQIFAIFIKNHNLTCDVFVFILSSLIFANRRCGAKITQNEKWPSFEGRCLNLKKNVVFVTSGWFCIITSKWMFWVFLSRTKCLFVNCVYPIFMQYLYPGFEYFYRKWKKYSKWQ